MLLNQKRLLGSDDKCVLACEHTFRRRPTVEEENPVETERDSEEIERGKESEREREREGGEESDSREVVKFFFSLVAPSFESSCHLA